MPAVVMIVVIVVNGDDDDEARKQAGTGDNTPSRAPKVAAIVSSRHAMQSPANRSFRGDAAATYSTAV